MEEEFPITPEMLEAGSNALAQVFNDEDFSKVSIVTAIYWAMRKAESEERCP